jgi:tetratricopeptide (TPR) repeat protein
MIMTVHDLANKALKFGLLDDALWLSRYLEEFEPIGSEDHTPTKRQRARRSADVLRGRVLLAQGNVQDACDCLRRMQASQPDRISIELADELLAARQRDVVIAYLEASVNNLKGKLDDVPIEASKRTIEDFESLIAALRKGSKKRPSLHIHWP